MFCFWDEGFSLLLCLNLYLNLKFKYTHLCSSAVGHKCLFISFHVCGEMSTHLYWFFFFLTKPTSASLAYFEVCFISIAPWVLIKLTYIFNSCPWHLNFNLSETLCKTSSWPTRLAGNVEGKWIIRFNLINTVRIATWEIQGEPQGYLNCLKWLWVKAS